MATWPASIVSVAASTGWLPSAALLASAVLAASAVEAASTFAPPASIDTDASGMVASNVVMPASEVMITPASIAHAWLNVHIGLLMLHGIVSQPFCAPSPSQSP